MGKYALRKRVVSTETETEPNEVEQGKALASKTAFFHYMLKIYSEDLEKKEKQYENKNSNNQKFNKWIRDISNGLTVFLYGAGSKHSLLQCFKQHILKTTDYNVLIVNGHNNSSLENNNYIEILRQLNSIFSIFDEAHFVGGNPKKINDQINEFFDNIASKNKNNAHKKTIVIFNNINYLTNDNTLNLLLMKLMNNEQFGLMATYINDEFFSTLSYYSILCSTPFVQYECNTLEPFWREIVATNYLENNFDMELALDQIKVRDKSNVKAGKIIDSVLCVYQSLTKNAQQIFDYIIKTIDSTSSTDIAIEPLPLCISHKQLYEYCRRNFLTTTESSLHSQLFEFIDHNLIEIVNDDNGDRCYKLKFKKSILAKLIDAINNISD